MSNTSKWIGISKEAVCQEKMHESLFRSWHVLREVKNMLDLRVAPEIILEAIDVMEYNEPKQDES